MKDTKSEIPGFMKTKEGKSELFNYAMDNASDQDQASIRTSKRYQRINNDLLNELASVKNSMFRSGNRNAGNSKLGADFCWRCLSRHDY